MYRILFVILLYSVQLPISHSQEFIPEEFLSSEEHSEALWKEQEKYLEHLNNCVEKSELSKRCGMTAVYHLKCILSKLHQEGEVYDLMSECSDNTL